MEIAPKQVNSITFAKNLTKVLLVIVALVPVLCWFLEFFMLTKFLVFQPFAQKLSTVLNPVK